MLTAFDIIFKDIVVDMNIFFIKVIELQIHLKVTFLKPWKSMTDFYHKEFGLVQLHLKIETKLSCLQ